MVTKNIFADINAKMAEVGATEGASEHTRSHAAIAFGNGLNALGNQLTIDRGMTSAKIAEALKSHAEEAVKAYFTGAVKAGGTVQAPNTLKVYAGQLATFGVVALKAHDLLGPAYDATLLWTEGKTKKECGDRSKFAVFYRTVSEIRAAIDKNKAPKTITPKYVGAAIEAAKGTRGAGTTTVTATPTEVKPPVEASLKDQLHEISAKLLADESTPANVKKALAVIAKWN